MRIIGRMLLILAAALVVVGVTTIFARMVAPQGRGFTPGAAERAVAAPGSFNGSSEQANSANQFERGARPGAFEAGRRGPAGIFAVTEVAKTVGVIAVIVVCVRFAARLRRWLRPPSSRRGQALPGSSE